MEQAEPVRKESEGDAGHERSDTVNSRNHDSVQRFVDKCAIKHILVFD